MLILAGSGHPCEGVLANRAARVEIGDRSIDEVNISTLFMSIDAESSLTGPVGLRVMQISAERRASEGEGFGDGWRAIRNSPSRPPPAGPVSKLPRSSIRPLLCCGDAYRCTVHLSDAWGEVGLTEGHWREGECGTPPMSLTNRPRLAVFCPDSSTHAL